jgi:hypothetical protein
VNKAGGTNPKSMVGGILPCLGAKRIPPHHGGKLNAVTPDLH